MLWPLLLPALLQQPDSPVPPTPADEESVSVEVVEVPSPLAGGRHQVIKLTSSNMPALLPVATLAGLEREMTALFRDLRPALVEVEYLVGTEPASGQALRVFASGLVMDNFGLLITPMSFDDEQRDSLSGNIKVYRTDGKVFAAELVEWNASYGLALLRAEGLKGLAPEFGRGLWMEEGSVTIGLGHPFGLPNSLSLGFLTGRQRGIGEAGNLMQITNPINVGAAGGLVANRHGQVVGMMYTSLADAARRAEDGLKLYVADFGTDALEGAKQSQGISFAVPAEILFSLFPEHFQAAASPVRRIGVLVEAQIRVLEEPGKEPCHAWEVVVTSIMPQTPGEASGIQPGDVILSLGGVPTSSLQELGYAIHTGPQATVLTVRRGEELLELPLEFEF
jgi:serine protease Do